MPDWVYLTQQNLTKVIRIMTITTMKIIMIIMFIMLKFFDDEDDDDYRKDCDGDCDVLDDDHHHNVDQDGDDDDDEEDMNDSPILRQVVSLRARSTSVQWCKAFLPRFSTSLSTKNNGIQRKTI